MTRKAGTALVLGAGIAGIRAALDLAEIGYGVALVERAAHLGGILSRLDNQFPTDHCGMCRQLPRAARDAASPHCLRRGLFHDNIEILLGASVTEVSGGPGAFRVSVKQAPAGVDPRRCVGCGRCAEACPVEVPDAFNAGRSTRRAVYLPVPHLFANGYVIDAQACTRCGACLAACPTAAIRLPEPERRRLRILVVDDELAVRDSLREWLDAEGFSAAMAASGAEALAALEAGGFHLLLLDVKMPGMDGIEVLDRAKRISPALAVIMMTAYATVETAVEAMKIGALDYLVKPFALEALMPKVAQVYGRMETAETRALEAGAIVIATGAGLADPAACRNTLGYGLSPDVMTQLEFERLLSGTGPTGGRLVRPSDGRPAARIAWLQCVGSRDLALEADFCSNICCMASIKEARLARERAAGGLEAVVFHMDLRTFGKGFQRYRERAESTDGVRLLRARPHSVVPEPDGGLRIRWADLSGAGFEEVFDLAVLAVGQRPAEGARELAESLDLALNPWGFLESEPFAPGRTRRPGIFIAGAAGGMQDIGSVLVQASAAAAAASRSLHAAGGGLALVKAPAEIPDSRRREPVRILAAVCRCESGAQGGTPAAPAAGAALLSDPEIVAVEPVVGLCADRGWEALGGRAAALGANRLLIGACLPHRLGNRLRELAAELGLEPSWAQAVDIGAWSFSPAAELPAEALARLKADAARLKHLNPDPPAEVGITPRVLVVGGGIAGMSAALAVADHGIAIDLVEAGERLGGNLNWLRTTLEGYDVAALLENCRRRVEAHARIRVHLAARIAQAAGELGAFRTVVEGPGGEVRVVEHGAVILATGGREAATRAHGWGRSPVVLTQSALEERLAGGGADGAGPGTVVMIQCVDSRREPRNYCSRICCRTALKHALAVKARWPETDVFVLHRDVMAYGFSEEAFTRTRRAGVFYIPYSVERPPRVDPGPEAATVTVEDPVIGRRFAIEAGLVVLATGIVPRLPREIAEAYGARLDPDGFFEEADPKWRPVEGLKEGVFACGTALAPGGVAESVASAEAAAARAVVLLSRGRLRAARSVARVRRSLCSLCGQCIGACPFEARTLDLERGEVRVHPILCQGCGACAAACPNAAAVLEGFAPQQVFAEIDAVLGR